MAGFTPLFQRRVEWVCPNNCAAHGWSIEGHAVRTHFHSCPRLKGLLSPMVEEGARVLVRAHEREDYLAGEIQRTGDDGKPYTSVTAERPDGSNDAAVFAPLAQGGLG